MKRQIIAVLAVTLFLGCAKKTTAPQITSWDQYSDPYFNLRFDYPKGWPVVSEGGVFNVYSSQEVASRFIDLSTVGMDGVRLVVSIEKMDTLKTLDQYIQGKKSDLTNSGYVINTSEPKQLAHMSGTLLDYSGALDNKTTIATVVISAMQDSSIYSLKYEGFNKLFDAYKVVFDTALATLKLPLSKSAQAEIDPSIPSSEFAAFENDFIKISYPDNFQTTAPQPKSPVESAIDIKGYRQDSNLHIDIMPAQGLTPEKVVEQNAKFYKETSRGNAMVDGVNTTFLSYSPVQGIKSRVYFICKNDRIYRTIINYPGSMEKTYLPVFEKMVGSLVIKK